MKYRQVGQKFLELSFYIGSLNRVLAVYTDKCAQYSSSCVVCTRHASCRFCLLKYRDRPEFLMDKTDHGVAILGQCVDIENTQWYQVAPRETRINNTAQLVVAQCSLIIPDFVNGFTCYDVQAGSSSQEYRNDLMQFQQKFLTASIESDKESATSLIQQLQAVEDPAPKRLPEDVLFYYIVIPASICVFASLLTCCIRRASVCCFSISKPISSPVKHPPELLKCPQDPGECFGNSFQWKSPNLAAARATGSTRISATQSSTRPSQRLSGSYSYMDTFNSFCAPHLPTKNFKTDLDVGIFSPSQPSILLDMTPFHVTNWNSDRSLFYPLSQPFALDLRRSHDASFLLFSDRMNKTHSTPLSFYADTLEPVHQKTHSRPGFSHTVSLSMLEERKPMQDFLVISSSNHLEDCTAKSQNSNPEAVFDDTRIDQDLDSLQTPLEAIMNSTKSVFSSQ